MVRGCYTIDDMDRFVRFRGVVPEFKKRLVQRIDQLTANTAFGHSLGEQYLHNQDPRINVRRAQSPWNSGATSGAQGRGMP